MIKHAGQELPAFVAAERAAFDAYGVDVHERFIDLRSPQLRLRVLEIGSGPPVVMLAGVTLQSAAWAPLLPHLSGVRAVIIELPGHGRSDPYDYRRVDVRAHAATLLQSALDALELERAQFVAHSLGGMFALYLASEAPKRVEAYVALGAPAGAPPGVRANAGLKLFATPGLGHLALSVRVPRSVYRSGVEVATGKPAALAVRPEVITAMWRGARLPGTASTISRLMRRLVSFGKVRPELTLDGEDRERVVAPSLFVWGEDDFEQSPDAARPWVERFPHARLVAVPGGHQPWWDDPARCAALILEHFDRVRKSTS